MRIENSRLDGELEDSGKYTIITKGLSKNQVPALMLNLP